MNEKWKDIPNYEGFYQVSNLGRVKTLSRVGIKKNGSILTVKERIKKFRIGSSGYYLVDLKVNNSSKTFRVHQLVAIAFLNHSPKGFKVVVDHIDNDKLNNKLNNLQLLSNRENTSKTKRPNSTSKYIGVHLNRLSNKFHATIRIEGKKTYLGSYVDEDEAHSAYLEKLKEINK